MPRPEEKIRRKPTAYHQLESRCLLAGMVFVDMSGPNLIVIGNDLDNAFSVDLSGETASEVVQGQHNTGVRYYDRFDDSMPLESIEDVRIYSNAGNDTVTIFADGFSAKDDLVVSLGFGDDTLYVVGGEIEDDVRIYCGAGHDSVSFNRSIIGDDIAIAAGAGTDVIAFNHIDVDDQTRVFGQFGHDTILSNGSIYGHQTYIELGDGADRFESTGSVFLDRFSVRGRGGYDYFTRTGTNDFTNEPNVQTIELQPVKLNASDLVEPSIDQLNSAFLALGAELSDDIGNVCNPTSRRTQTHLDWVWSLYSWIPFHKLSP